MILNYLKYRNYKIRKSGSNLPDSVNYLYFISIWLILLVLIIFPAGCFTEHEENKRPIDQYNIDNSNNYKYIFKDIVDKERKKGKNGKKKENFED